MGEVVVEGAPPATSSPTATVVEVADLGAAADLGTAVARAPGAHVRRLGGLGAWTSVSLRGSSAEQVEVLLDGVPLNPDGGSAVDLSQLPLRAFERVEVYRGAVPFRFGSAPLGGAVNLVTPSRPNTSLATSYGSFRTARVAGTTGTRGHLGEADSRVWLAVEGFSTRGDYQVFDDRGTWYNPDDDVWTRRANNDKRQGDAWLSASVRTHRTTWTLIDGVMAREGGLAGALGHRTLQARSASLRHLSALQLDAGTATARVWALDTTTTLDDPAMEVGPGIVSGTSRATTLGGSATGTWSVGPALSAQALLDGRHERAVTGPTHDRTVGRAAVALTASDRRQRFIATPALHLTAVGASVAEPTTILLLPRLDLRGALGPELALAAHLGRGARPPSMEELLGDGALLVGNPALRAERGWQADVGLRTEHAKALTSRSLELALFGVERAELIAISQNAQGLGRAENRGHAVVTGVELAATVERLDRVGVDAQLTAQRAVDTSDDPAYRGRALPLLPWLDAGAHAWVQPRPALRLSAGATYTSASYHDATNWFRSAPRPLVDAGASLRFAPRWRVEASLLNALDVRRERVDPNPLDDDPSARTSVAITDLWGFPLPGRTALVTLHLEPGARP